MADEKKEEPKGLALLMMPFEAHEILKLPKPYKKESPKGKCQECGGVHGLPAVHLDYVGHAALTKRLLQADPSWTWEPMALEPCGTPLLDKNGGMWIRLTVCDVTRLGYGFADGKTGGNAVKETIGDALRNAAMRFGAALDLWHKGDLYDADELKDMGVEVEAPKPYVEVNKLTGRPMPPRPEVNPRVSAAPPPVTAPPAGKKLSPEEWTETYIGGLTPIASMLALNTYTTEHSAALIKLDKIAPDLRDRIELAIAETRHRIENLNPFEGVSQ